MDAEIRLRRMLKAMEGGERVLFSATVRDSGVVTLYRSAEDRDDGEGLDVSWEIFARALLDADGDR